LPSFATFAAHLRAARLAAELSQEQLAERARVSTSAIGAYERGVRVAPHRDTVTLLADALGLHRFDTIGVRSRSTPETHREA
jgi:transcriptional regulator with XRE-family HTH domain